MNKFALAGLLAFALGTSGGATAETGSAIATTSTIRPNGPEAFSKVTPLTPEQHELLDQRLEKLHDDMIKLKGSVPPGPQVAVPSNKHETNVGAAIEGHSETLPSPSAFYIGTNKKYSLVGDGESTTAEPAIANSGKNWLVTQNWSRGYSTTAGAKFTEIADDAGPSDAPFFCCDQDAVHDHGRDLTVWSELFVNSALTTGAVRLHVRAAN